MNQLKEPAYTGELITPVKTKINSNLELKEMENNHAIAMKKLDVATDVLQIGKQIINILQIRANSAARISEIDAEIRKLEKITDYEIALRCQDRDDILAKGKVVTDILKELTTVLFNQHLSTEDRKAAMELYNEIIPKVLKNE
ncbi:hypothetical protein ABES02_27635 [Neobacillus pocheonensis]|uniref:hypothetical protein n=1 Tax=Neobacillus pocheonensis TaxID=363869 RepID=UPI003D2B6B0D